MNKLTFSIINLMVMALTATAVHAGASAGASGPVVSFKAKTEAIDYANAKEMPLPQSATAPTSMLETLLDAQSGILSLTDESASVFSGSMGVIAPTQNPVTLVSPSNLTSQPNSNSDEVAPAEYGTANQPYTTKRTNNNYGAGYYSTTRNYPFRAAGRLFFKIGSSTYVCSASLIKPGVIVTAAHCVYNFGANSASGWYNSWQFVPAYDNGVAPYGVINGVQAWVMTSYYNGTDSCYQKGVVCQNDVAVIKLASNVGATVGWFGYGYGNWGYINGTTHVTQLGYPVALDGGYLQERTDSQGYISGTFSYNTIIGSLMTGGSSGGPWVQNLGINPVLYGIGFGAYSNGNIVTGVTSWGYTSTTVKQQGASPFTSSNILPLVNAACTGAPAGWC